MKLNDARIAVLEFEIVTLRGLRWSPQIEVADAAREREREIAQELEELKRAGVEQMEPAHAS